MANHRYAHAAFPDLHDLTVHFKALELVSCENKSLSECHDAGFNSETLQCSSCNELPQFHLDQLVDDCNACCTPDEGEMQHQKYPLAHIEICECNLGRFPQVQAFVKSDMVNQWGNHVKVRHVRGTLPTIKLKDVYGETQQTLNIEKWDTDTITEFLNTWIEY
uniref:Selenoprotein F n=1 Tax=Ascaris lumbricoides TaxID=6252 RepID=A0A0M3ICU9_ASCLU